MDFEGAQKLADFIDSTLPEEAFKGFEKQMNDLADQATQSAYDYMRENLGYWYAQDVRNAAETAITAILKGQVNIARQYLKLNGFNGRSDGVGRDRDISEQHRIIHGNMFESECLEIRRKVAEAHPDLVRDERIRDLEDQLDSAVAQNKAAEAEIERLRNR